MNAIFLRSAANGLMLEREREGGQREEREWAEEDKRQRDSSERGNVFRNAFFNIYRVNKAN